MLQDDDKKREQDPKPNKKSITGMLGTRSPKKRKESKWYRQRQRESCPVSWQVLDSACEAISDVNANIATWRKRGCSSSILGQMFGGCIGLHRLVHIEC